ncbi:MAG: hypothetical protein CGU28_12670 [Candidatus Dactylopiibacterium carminicum]|uniref:DUF2726 domain-containing protein n=1 Tax=Candidatus Dactylopiibacterium carminicum TaxID=857335 RepID=A0A272EPF3_9RHOO|nr:hypothetical protein [Candidatus Dactylopiibacterium carminicum]KAF7598317.1 hypothetical protein BGI27_14035 [Candidatus Dactylopiibacterium carminicum]PAS92015.1 MAG: hypothetical protein CGU29_13350 [Candidatus Dactylopiibacterium carminicum]PAS95438.1 MAG: hypothetical protein CGU28_12670 [Candidatus Dactylopiibacterium carminicum]PAS97314.1 MAG: hypothetical protein BSR46_14060 [Candidatus Dactylopiibacterium carminicum]
MIGWLLFAGLLGGGGYWAYRAWRNWQENYGHRNDDYDAGQLALLLHEKAGPERPTPPAPPPRPMPSGPPARFLPLTDAVQTLYVLLRAEFPQLPMMCCVDIASLLPDTPRPPRIQIDFVICRKDFSPAVAIIIERPNEKDMLDQAQALLRERRLRVLRWSADALPGQEEIRQQIVRPKLG